MARERHQQDITSFREGDCVLIIQNGREMKIKIEAFVNAIAEAVNDRVTVADLTTIEAKRALDEAQDAEAMAGIQDQINAMPTPPDVPVPQAGTATPGAPIPVDILGNNLVLGAGVTDLHSAVVAILAALRAAKIIQATPA